MSHSLQGKAYISKGISVTTNKGLCTNDVPSSYSIADNAMASGKWQIESEKRYRRTDTRICVFGGNHETLISLDIIFRLIICASISVLHPCLLVSQLVAISELLYRGVRRISILDFVKLHPRIPRLFPGQNRFIRN